jgi:hypothetical protein
MTIGKKSLTRAEKIIRREAPKLIKCWAEYNKMEKYPAYPIVQESYVHDHICLVFSRKGIPFVEAPKLWINSIKGKNPKGNSSLPEYNTCYRDYYNLYLYRAEPDLMISDVAIEFKCKPKITPGDLRQLNTYFLSKAVREIWLVLFDSEGFKLIKGTRDNNPWRIEEKEVIIKYKCFICGKIEEFHPTVDTPKSSNWHQYRDYENWLCHDCNKPQIHKLINDILWQSHGRILYGIQEIYGHEMLSEMRNKLLDKNLLLLGERDVNTIWEGENKSKGKKETV